MVKMTIKEISRLAGVSPATVSHVLNKHEGRYSHEVAERVMRVVVENNYVPNKSAKNLRENRTNTIGILAEDITHFQTPSIIAGINNCIEKYSMHMILENLSLMKKFYYDFDKAFLHKNIISEAINVLMNARVDGIIYIGWQDRDVTNLIPPIDIPLAYAYCYTSEKVSSWISYDNESSMVEIIDRVVALGHRKIAVLAGGNQNFEPTAKRLKIYHQKLSELSIPLRNEYIKYGDWSFEDGKKLYRELISLDDPPTAILSLNDVMAAGVIRESIDTDRKVLDEISVVGFNAFEFTRYINPTLATVRLPLEEIGYNVAEQLLAEVNDRNMKPKKQYLRCEFVDGDSLRKCTE